MKSVIESSKIVTVIDEVDICIIGGSCTGVFAAVRAARLGAKVAVVEKQNCFGGVATTGLVNIWHSLLDFKHEKQIISGLTVEIIERLKKRDAVTIVHKDYNTGFNLNTEELKIELDELIIENDIIPYLNTYFCDVFLENEELKGVFVENKSGRGVILSKIFVDATGDGDLCKRLGLECYTREIIQPPTMCAKFYGMNEFTDINLQEFIHSYKDEFNIKEDWGWSTFIPNMPKVTLHAETHVFNTDSTDSKSLTFSEIEGRRQIRKIMDMVRKYAPNSEKIALADLASSIGIRESRHVRCRYQITEQDVLFGRRFDDAIGYGSYRVDIHHKNKPGITFRYLDGLETYFRTGHKVQFGRWREVTDKWQTYYQIPFRSLVPKDNRYRNVLICGRMIDADEGAFGACRVMVNMNQTGEAAGVAAFLALCRGKFVDEVDAVSLRTEMKRGGSIIMDS